VQRIGARGYAALVVTEDFLNPATPVNLTLGEVNTQYEHRLGLSAYYQTGGLSLDALLYALQYQKYNDIASYKRNFSQSPASSLKNHADTLERLENSACLDAYAKKNNEWTYGNLLIVVDSEQSMDWLATFAFLPDNTVTDQKLNYGRIEDWWCPVPSDRCDIEGLIDNAADWSITTCSEWDSAYRYIDYCQDSGLIDHPVKYCLAQTDTSRCKIVAYPQFLLIVVICNLLKVVGLLAILFQPGYHPLATFGDAVSSFLEQQNPTTKHLGTLTQQEVLRTTVREPGGISTTRILTTCVWKSSRPFWFKTASKTKWTVATTSLVCLLRIRRNY
jgi:hypothetical protein